MLKVDSGNGGSKSDEFLQFYLLLIVKIHGFTHVLERGFKYFSLFLVLAIYF